MKKLWNIACGWWLYITNQNNKLAQGRLSICRDCELRKWFVCGQCGCPLNAKVRLPEEQCPHPNGNLWIYMDNFHMVHPLKNRNFYHW